MKIFYLHIAIFLILSTFKLSGQQNNNLYFLHNVQQSNQLNAALKNNCKFSIGGIIMPITGQLLPPLYFNYSNNAFAYKNIIYPGEGLQSDSLVTVFSNLSDATQFLNQLKKTNYLGIETNIDILHATLNFENQAFSFSITDKIITRFYYSDDFVRFFYELNGKNLLGTNAQFNLGYDFNYYREYAFGYQRNISEKLSLGAKTKLLFGKANIFTENNEFSWQTDAEDFTYNFNTQMKINYAIPGFTVNNFYYSDSLHEFVIDDSLAEFEDEWLNYITNNKNRGLGFDIGATYTLNDQFTFYGSIVDLGFIKWTTNASKLVNIGNFQFSGIDVLDILDSDSLSFQDNLMDTIFSSTEVKISEGNYIKMLPMKVYLGAKYSLNEKIAFGALVRSEFFQQKLHASMTLSMNAYISRKFQTAISYSIINSSYFNFGFGFVYNAGPFQFYIVNDNVTGMIFPQTARNVNFRFGINWAFGCGVTNTTLIK